MPAAQKLQGPPAGPVEPAVQLQAAMDGLAEGDLEFGGHPEHADSADPPASDKYLFAAQ